MHGQLDDRRLTDQEQLQAFVNLIIGRLETTANGLGSAMKNLAARPDLRRRLAEGADINRACDEFLRFESPVAGIRRLVTRDTTIGGTHLHAGDWVYVSFGAANLDPDVFPNPDALNIERPEAGKHAAFGAGPHRCLGSHLARMELRVGLEEVLRRLPEVSLDPDRPLTWRNSITRGPLSLPLVFPVAELSPRGH